MSKAFRWCSRDTTTEMILSQMETVQQEFRTTSTESGNRTTTTTTTIIAMEKPTCPICYEEFADTSSYSCTIDVAQEGTSILPNKIKHKHQRLQIPGCHHEFCYECLVTHCKISIASRNIPVPCPQAAGAVNEQQENDEMSPTTTHCLSPELLERLLTTTKVTKSRKSKSENPVVNNPWESPLHVFPMTVSSANQSEPENGDLKDWQQSTRDLEEQQELQGIVPLSNTYSTEISTGCSSDSSSVTSTSSSPAYWQKFVRFTRLQQDPSLLTCPRCEELVPPPPPPPLFPKERTGHNDEENPIDEDAAQVDPYVKCPSCHHLFCSIHGDIHAGQDCAEFLQSHRARDMEQSEHTINSISKKCSHGCGARITRSTGCDHIVCTNCNRDMCYKCGTHEFLSGKVIRSCSNCKQGFVDHRFYSQYRCRLFLILPIHLILSIVYMVMAAVACVLTGGFCCCFYCGTREWDFEGEKDHASSSGKINLKKGFMNVMYVIGMPLVELFLDLGIVTRHEIENEDNDKNEQKS